MPRKVFFSFHYDDVTRANIVRNSDQITRWYKKAARFHDKSLWEEAKKQGSIAIQRMIDEGLRGSSVTCVLIGSRTWERPWVRYEILASLARGNGILGVRIHDVGFAPRRGSVAMGLQDNSRQAANPWMHDVSYRQPTLGSLFGLGVQRPSPPQSGILSSQSISDVFYERPPEPGPNPLRYLGYSIDRSDQSIQFHEIDQRHRTWCYFDKVRPVSLAQLPWLATHSDAANLGDLFHVYDWKLEHGSYYFPTWIEEAAAQVGR
jgi:hypothetical protein